MNKAKCLNCGDEMGLDLTELNPCAICTCYEESMNKISLVTQGILYELDRRNHLSEVVIRELKLNILEELKRYFQRGFRFECHHTGIICADVNNRDLEVIDG